MTRVSLWSVLLKRNFIHKEHELVLSPYEADNVEFTTYISTEPPKYVKLHINAESNPNLWNDWTELALLAANRLRNLGSKIRKRQIVPNADANQWSNFRHDPLH